MEHTGILTIMSLLFLVNIGCIVFLFKSKDDSGLKDEIKTDMMLLNRNFFSLKKEVEELSHEVERLGALLQEGDIQNQDELTKCLKRGMTSQEIAKKMNRSVKEIDLMVKLRGSR